MIKIQQLSKAFRVYRRRRGMLKELVGWAQEGRDFDTIHSLKNISLDVPKSEVHGIIGMNGAGKSTLLKILTGVLDPSSGSIVMEGRVAALLELGTGFHSELTGRENIYLNASIMGFSQADVDAKIPEIIAFAELGTFFDKPVKIYSSGMYVRLAFAFAVSVEPDVLIIDEALSVGDAYFQQKCLKKIRSFRDKGTTVLFVSHDLGAVKSLCDRVSLLSHGELVYSGTPLKALDLYNALLAEHRNLEAVSARIARSSEISEANAYESGSKAVEILSVKIAGVGSNDGEAFVSGEEVELVIRARANQDFKEGPTCGILIRDRMGYDVFGTNTFSLQSDVGPLNLGQTIEYRFATKLNLGAGDYTLTIALHSDKSHVDENYHWIDRAKVFKVLPSNDFEFIGITRLEPRCRIDRLN